MPSNCHISLCVNGPIGMSRYIDTSAIGQLDVDHVHRYVNKKEY